MDNSRTALLRHLTSSLEFESLEEAVLQRLADGARLQHHRKDAKLYEWGEKADELVVILRGRLDISRDLPNGRRMLLRRLGPGSIVGWSLIAGEPHTADLIAATKLEVARISGRTIRRLFEQEPALPLSMIASLGALVGELSDDIAEYRFKSLDQRTLRTIRKLAMGRKRLNTTQADLAAAVGATRENVARALARLEGRELITRGRGWVELTQVIKDFGSVCTWDDFFHHTRVNWRRVAGAPKRAPDFASGEGSRYWDTGKGVYRASNHWNGYIHGCEWLLDGAAWQRPAVGFAEYAAFERIAPPD